MVTEYIEMGRIALFFLGFSTGIIVFYQFFRDIA